MENKKIEDMTLKEIKERIAELENIRTTLAKERDNLTDFSVVLIVLILMLSTIYFI